jgi:hypothetical protein
MQNFSLKKWKNLERKEQFRVAVSNKFTTVENLEAGVGIIDIEETQEQMGG